MAAAAALVGSRTSGTGNLTTVGGSTSPTGSTFVIAVSFDGSVSINGPGAGNTPNDNKGNAYTLIDAQSAASTVALYYCQNGTGGAGHTASANFTGSSFGSIYLIEVAGVLTASVLDKTNKTVTSSPPISLLLPSTGSFTQADEMIIAIQGSGSGGPDYTSSNMTQIDEETNGGAYWTSGIFKLLIASTTAVTLNLGGGDSNSIAVAASFKASVGGGSSVVPRAMAHSRRRRAA